MENGLENMFEKVQEKNKNNGEDFNNLSSLL